MNGAVLHGVRQTCDLLGEKRLIEKDVPPAPSHVCRERTGSLSGRRRWR